MRGGLYPGTAREILTVLVLVLRTGLDRQEIVPPVPTVAGAIAEQPPPQRPLAQAQCRRAQCASDLSLFIVHAVCELCVSVHVPTCPTAAAHDDDAARRSWLTFPPADRRFRLGTSRTTSSTRGARRSCASVGVVFAPVPSRVSRRPWNHTATLKATVVSLPCVPMHAARRSHSRNGLAAHTECGLSAFAVRAADLPDCSD